MAVEKLNYDSNFWPEIKAILKNKRVVNSEVDFLKIALDHNKNTEIVKNTSKKELLRIQKALKPLLYANKIKWRFNDMLKIKSPIRKRKNKNIKNEKINYKAKFSTEINKLIKRNRISEDDVNSRLSRWVREIKVWSKKILILKSASIWKEDKEKKKNNIEINTRDIRDFAAMVKAESWWESIKWQIAVAYIIINRMKQWNKSMRQVLYKKTSRWKSEFSPLDDWRFNKMKRRLASSDIQLVKDVLNSKLRNPIWNATFFQNIKFERNKNTWQERAEKKWKLVRIATIWNHIFRAIA